MKKTFTIAVVLLGVLIYAGCKKTEMDLTSYSDVPVLPSTVYDYQVSAGNNEATLGRVLFYDKKMSLNNSVSCGSCHQQSKAFCDNKQFSPGLQGQLTRRNTPAVMVHDNTLFWDGRAANFHDLAVMPLENHVEMKNYDLSQLEAKIASVDYYPALFTQAYGDAEVTMDRIQQALGAFMSAFKFFKNKREDMHHNLANYTAEETLGEEVFFGKGKCFHCHTVSPPTGAGGWGGGATGQQECIGLDETYTDNGLGELTHNTAQNAMFRVPQLMNIEYTAPYMHDGRFKTLEEVVEHYDSGIKAHPNLHWAFKDFPELAGMTTAQIMALLDTNFNGFIDDNEMPAGTAIKLNLTHFEKKGLVAFLKTLSDPAVFSDERFSDPFRIK